MLFRSEASHIEFPLQVVKKGRRLAEDYRFDSTILSACTRMTHSPAMPRNIGWESGPVGQHASNSNADEKNPTLVVEFIIITKRCDEAMTAKYIPASLVTVLRTLETFTPRFIDLMICACTMTSTKTPTSTRANRRLNSRKWRGDSEG